MNEKTKESKFLDAINKYAESQKAQITQEIEDYKNTKIEQATNQGLQDAYELIKSDIAGRKAVIVRETAQKELEIRRGLFAQRQQIRDEVFAQAELKLREFVKSEDYIDWLKKQAEKINKLFSGNKCTVYISRNDADKSQIIADILPGAVITEDNSVRLGGIRGYCRSLGIIADCTLDKSLEAQQQWFSENSGLKVV